MYQILLSIENLNQASICISHQQDIVSKMIDTFSDIFDRNSFIMLNKQIPQTLIQTKVQQFYFTFELKPNHLSGVEIGRVWQVGKNMKTILFNKFLHFFRNI
ncbi:hypothetical protein ABPG74_019321 [Tetrahymena malaccensis]